MSVPFTITFNFPAQENLDVAIAALAKDYGFDFTSKDSREDFVKDRLLAELSARVVRVVGSDAADTARAEAQKQAQAAAQQVSID